MTDHNPTGLNPYAPPSSLPTKAADPLPKIAVDGRFLVVASGAVLPPRCIKTNEAMTSMDAVHRTLSWRGKAFRLISTSRKCNLVWYAKPWYRWHASPLRWLLLLAFLAIVYAGPPGPIELILIVALIATSFFANRSLPRIVNYKDSRFWIKGCCPEFLESLQRDLDRDED